MATSNSKQARRAPKVRLVKPGKRCYQLRYLDPDTGREVRTSTKTHDVALAEEKKRDLEAQLRLGLEPQRIMRTRGPGMPWEDFRAEYARLKQWRSENGRYSAEYRLDVMEAIAKPRRLRDLTHPEALSQLEAELATTRSEHTVAGYMATLLAALNWAHHSMQWLPEPVRYRRSRTSTLETHRGRPITDLEFNRMLEACAEARGSDPASWQFLLRGLWETGLRLSEAMMVSWDVPRTIQPKRHVSGGIVLQIPAKHQKSRKDSTIGTVPGFAQLLDSVPESQRTGWVFNPTRQRGEGRLNDARRVGRIISRIGEAAEVYVNDDEKPASAHDIRRSFGQRLADAGVPAMLLQSVMRHTDLATTQKYYLKSDAAKETQRLGAYLGTLAGKAEEGKPLPIDVSPCQD